MAAERAKGLLLADHGLVPVANRPLLLYGLDAMRAAGIREVGILAEGAVGEAIRGLIGKERGAGVRVRYLPGRPGADAGECLAAAAPFLGGSPCVAQLESGLVRGEVQPLVDELVRDGLDALLLVDPSRRTVTSLGQRRLLRLVDGDPSAPLAGFHVLGPRLVREAAGGGSLAEIVERLLAGGGCARTRPSDGAWKQVARTDELLEANRVVLDELEPGLWRGELIESRVEGRVSIGPGAVLESSVVRGPSVIGSRARLRHAYVGPYTAIGDEVEVVGAEIEHSIVLPGAVIRHVGGRLEASVVGRRARLFRDFALPKAMRVRLADGDEIALS
jgi:glucose-1-phosphate thymidylyltransferase